MTQFSDLEALEERHRREEEAETRTSVFERGRPLGIELPRGEPIADDWRARVAVCAPPRPRPFVLDPLGSASAFAVSPDGVSVLDAASQTASLPEGYSPRSVVTAYFDGVFGDAELAADRLARLIAQVADGTGLPHIGFASSGAEAVEVAIAALHQASAEAGSVRSHLVTFERGFHGRTELLFQASHQLCTSPSAHVTVLPLDGGAEALEQLLRKRDDVLCVLLEPVQCAGGERYVPIETLRAIRTITRAHEVPLVSDEVQTGFGAGGALLWAPEFEADVVCFGKRAQLGVLAANVPLPASSALQHPTTDQVAALRAVCSLEETHPSAKVFARKVRERFEAIVGRFPDLILDPRVRAWSAGFEVAGESSVRDGLIEIAERSGIRLLPASDHTVRIRFSRAFGDRELDAVFDVLRAAAKWIEAERAPSEFRPPRRSLRDAPPVPSLATKTSSTEEPATPRPARDVRVRQVDAEEVEAVLDAIVALEARVYEPARRDPREKLARAFEDPAGVAVIADRPTEDGTIDLLGVTLGVPLERVDVDGADRDLNRGRQNTVYVVATTLDPTSRGLGLGMRLKRALVHAAAAVRRSDGSLRYDFMTGRMRVGATSAMRRINRRLGATELYRLHGQYGGEGAAIYYRLPLRAPGCTVGGPLFRSSLLRTPPPSLVHYAKRGGLYGPVVEHLRLHHTVTPATVRGLEYLSALTPHQPMVALSGSLGCAFDEVLRVLKGARPKASVALGLEGGFVGDTTAAARSLSDPASLEGVRPYFEEGFARLPHPREDAQRFEAAVEAIDPAQILAVFAEPVQVQTGAPLLLEHWSAFKRLRAAGVPIVSVETATGGYRSLSEDGVHRPFADLGFEPDVRLWAPAPRLGLAHFSRALGDGARSASGGASELSLVVLHHVLRHLASLQSEDAGALLHASLTPLRDAGVALSGEGLYRVASVGDRRDAFLAHMTAAPFEVWALPGGRVGFAPPFDLLEEEWLELSGVVSAAWSKCS